MDGAVHRKHNDVEKMPTEIGFEDSLILHIQRLSQIGIALSSEQNLAKLLEMIVEEAMAFTNADAGTLYTVDNSRENLHFEILRNFSMNTRLGGTSGFPIELPSVPLYVNDQKNYSNVSSYVALTGKLVNISDVYEGDDFDFSGPKRYDAQTGYHSESMLVIPLKNHDNETIGVLQLLNAPRSGHRKTRALPGGSC